MDHASHPEEWDRGDIHLYISAPHPGGEERDDKYPAPCSGGEVRRDLHPAPHLGGDLMYKSDGMHPASQPGVEERGDLVPHPEGEEQGDKHPAPQFRGKGESGDKP